MALATQCPHCHTTFRVANDQLKLHAGIVRCGACQQTFNGIEHLLAPPQANVSTHAQTEAPPATAAVTPTITSPATPTVVAAPAVAPPAIQPVAPENPIPEPALPVTTAPVASVAPTPSVRTVTPESIPDVLLMPTAGRTEPHFAAEEHDKLDFLLDIEGDWEIGQRQVPDPALQADEAPAIATPDDSQALSVDDASANYAISDLPEDDITSVAEMPGFVLAHQQQQKNRRVLTVLLSLGSLLLSVAMLAQLVYVFRTQLAANYPASKPALQQACNWLRCKIDLQSQIDNLSIEGNELQAMPSAGGNLFSLAVQFRNHGNTAQNWPALELSLNDAKDRPVLRRIFNPSEYLNDKADLNKGLAPNAEQNIKLFFELNKVKAAGYHVEIFYP
jgi:predicted Zn finger-like uncharacterized protein